jgi:hypothetical protein
MDEMRVIVTVLWGELKRRPQNFQIKCRKQYSKSGITGNFIKLVISWPIGSHSSDVASIHFDIYLKKFISVGKIQDVATSAPFGSPSSNSFMRRTLSSSSRSLVQTSLSS